MEDLLKELDIQLKTLRLDYYTHLKAPLTDAEINVLEKQYNMELPNDVKLLYKWKNGQYDNCYESFVNNSMFVTLQNSLYTAEDSTSMIGYDFEIENWWNEHWIPLFHNGAGDLICYDAGGCFTGNKGQIIEFWHADNDRNVIAPDLKTFIASIYNRTQIEEFDRYFAVESPKGYPLKFIVNKPL